MSIRETFSNLTDLAMINEYEKSAVMQISTVLWHVYHVACPKVLSNATFKHVFNHVFGVRNSENTRAMRVIFSFQNIENLT